MARKLDKDRVFRHMAKEVPNYKVVYISRDDLLDMHRRDVESAKCPVRVRKVYNHWRRLAEIKFGNYVDYETFTDYDIDFDRYRYGMVAREKPVRRVRV